MEQIEAACEADRAGRTSDAMELYCQGLEQLVLQPAPAMDAVIEKHTARLEELVGAHSSGGGGTALELQQTQALFPAERTFSTGQKVMYQSVTTGRWIQAKVVRVHTDGTISLDVRARADPTRIRPWSEPGRAAAPDAIDPMAKKYYTDHVLAHTDQMRDGFYDGGRGRPLRPLAQMRAAEVDERREVIVADATTDPVLARWVERCKTSIAVLPTRESQVLALSLLVSSLMGGHRGEQIEVECQAEMRRLKLELGSNVVPLGAIQIGCCRHRAVLFKYLADSLGMPTRLVRGAWTDCEEESARPRENGVKAETRELGFSGHAWNVVYIESPPTDTGAAAPGMWRVVDTMLEPGTALLPSNASAQHYARRVGAASLARRRIPTIATGDRMYGGAGTTSLAGNSPKKSVAATPKQLPKMPPTSASEEADPPGAIGFEQEVHFDTPRLQLGRGSFGVVYKATWRGLTVAVKEIALMQGGEATAARDGDQPPVAPLAHALQEVDALSRLPRHKNIAAYYGSYLAASVDSEVTMHMVLENCSGGTLYDALHHGAPLSQLQRSHIANGVAAGLAAIHERRPAVLHQDLSTNNVLLAGDGEAKLADFGLARVRAGTASFQTQHLRGTPHYMSPEVWEGRHITEAVDVYALAMVMYETWTGEVPWSGFRVNEIGKRVTRGERPKPPAASFGALVQSAWAQNPSERPTASSLSTSLHRRDEALQELASCGATAFSDVSSATLFTLLKTLGHASDSSLPSQLQQAAKTALRAEGLSTYE